MFAFSWMAVLCAAAATPVPVESPQSPASPPPVSEAAPPPAAEKPSAEARLEALEQELERLRLRLPQEEDESSAQPTPVAAPAAASPNLFNPTLTVVGNGLYRYDSRPVLGEAEGDEAPPRLDNQFNLRELELDFRAAIDPFADGVVIVALESPAPGVFEAGVEEGYALIKRLPLPLLDEAPLGLKLKVGRFRTELGRFNRLHLHDLPQTQRPLVTEEFLGEEGHIGNGLSAQLFLPTPDDASALELTLQAVTGGGIALAESPARSPGLIGNLRWFRPFGSDHQLDLSLIFHHGKTDAEATLDAYTYSADFLYRWKPSRGGERQSFVLGGQLFWSRRWVGAPVDTDDDGVPDTTETQGLSPFGYFAFAQYQLPFGPYLGARWDDTQALNEPGLRRRAVSGYLTWYPSEFLRFRAGYEHRLGGLEEESGRHSVFGELTFVFGAHPTEPFWVNK